MKRGIGPNRGYRGPQLLEQRRASEIRREREIGNWGRASEHIGRRWEELGFERLHDMLNRRQHWPVDRYRPHSLVPLMSDTTIQASLARVGLPSPDVVVVLADGRGGLVLQALDFKWDLEFASYDQIRATALQALLQRDRGVLDAAIVRATGQPVAGNQCLDGLLFAPDSPANQRFLSSTLNQRREYPIEAREVILEPVDPTVFFSPQPGWELAVRLAALDRAAQTLQTLDGADRYYRLGAGLRGAVSQLQVSVFEADPPAVDAAAAIAWLQTQVRVLSSSALIAHVERLMAAREQRVVRLRRLTRSPYRLADLSRALAAQGIVLPERPDDGEVPPERQHWLEMLRRVGAEYRATIQRAGLRLTRGGLSDDEALARLEADRPRFVAGASALGERLIASKISTNH